MNDVFVRIKDMPCFINGYTVLDNNGDYNIYLNSAYSFEEQRITYLHELRHIRRSDFFGNRSIKNIENL